MRHFSQYFRRFTRVAARLLHTNPIPSVAPSYLHIYPILLHVVLPTALLLGCGRGYPCGESRSFCCPLNPLNCPIGVAVMSNQYTVVGSKVRKQRAALSYSLLAARSSELKSTTISGGRILPRPTGEARCIVRGSSGDSTSYYEARTPLLHIMQRSSPTLL